MIHVPGGGDHAVAAKVAAPVHRLEVRGGEGPHALGRAEDRVAVGMRGAERLGVQLEDEVVGRVVHAVDLLEHHVALEGEVLVAEQRPADQVGEDVDGQRQVGVEDVGLVAGVVAAGVGVEAPAPHLELERDLVRGAPLGALEHHVLEQMGDPHHGASLVGAGGPDPDPQCGRAHPRQLLRQEGAAVGCARLEQPVVETDGLHCPTPSGSAPSGTASSGRVRPPRAA